MRSLLLLAMLCAACDAPTSPDVPAAPSFLTLPCRVLQGTSVNPCARPTIDPSSVQRPTLPAGVMRS